MARGILQAGVGPLEELEGVRSLTRFKACSAGIEDEDENGEGTLKV